MRANGATGGVALNSDAGFTLIFTDTRRIAGSANGGFIDIENVSSVNTDLDVTTVGTLTGLNHTGGGITSLISSHSINLLADSATNGSFFVVNAGTAGDTANGDDLVVNANINHTNSGTVTLTSNDNISFTGGVVSNAGGSVTLTANNGGNNTGSISDANGTNDVTALNLTTSAATGIDLDTTITNLQGATNSTSGAIDISNTGSLTITGTGVSNASTGDINILAASPLNVFTDVVNTGGGNINLTASGTAITDILNLNGGRVLASGGTNQGAITLTGRDVVIANSTFNPDVSTTGGDITINTNDNVAGGGSGDLLTISSNVQIESNGGDITFNTDDLNWATGLTSINAGTGNIIIAPSDVGTFVGIGGSGNLNPTEAQLLTLTANTVTIGRADSTAPVSIGDFDADINLSGASFSQLIVQGANINLGPAASNGILNLGANDLNLIALSGAITDSNGATNNVVANNLTLSAVTGIDLDTTVSNLSGVTNTTSGDITIDNAGALTSNSAIVNSGGSITINTGGAFNTTANINSNADLSIATSAGGIVINNPATVTVGGNLDLNATANITANVVFNVTGNASFDANANISATQNNSFNGTVTFDASNNVSFFAVSGFELAGANVGGTVSLSIFGDITDGGAATLTTSNLAFTTLGSFIFDNPGHDFQLVAAESNAVANGDITIIDSVGNLATEGLGLIALVAGIETDSGNIVIETPGTFDVTTGAGISTTVGGGNGNVDITATDIIISDTISAGTGNITIQPSDPSSDIDVGTAAAGGGPLDIDDTELANLSSTGTVTIGSATGTGTTNVDVAAVLGNDLVLRNGGIAVGNLILGFNDLSLIALDSAITDINGATINIGANNLALRGVTGIDIDTNVNTVAAQLTGTGAIDINNANALTVGNFDGVTGVTTNSGDISLDSVVLLSVSSAINAGSNGNITLTAADVAITAAINSNDAGTGDGTGTITLSPDNATDTIAIGTGSTASDFNIDSTEIGLLGTTGLVNIGQIGGTGAVSIQPTVLLDLSAENFDLGISGGNMLFRELTVGSNDVTLNSTGSIADSNGATNNITATDLTLTAATGIDLDITISNLAGATNSTSGDIFIDNTGNLLVTNAFVWWTWYY